MIHYCTAFSHDNLAVVTLSKIALTSQDSTNTGSVDTLWVEKNV